VRLDSYRTKLGVVLQESFLFDGTIRENVAFSRPNATEEQILEACRIARVDEFADRLKTNTTPSSASARKTFRRQRQRFPSRAPSWPIRASSSSTSYFQPRFRIRSSDPARSRVLMQGRTTFVIAHRLSTIRRADQILVVEAERSSSAAHTKSFYALGGRYFDLYTSSTAWRLISSSRPARATSFLNLS